MVWWEPEQPWRSGPWAVQVRGDEVADITFDGAPVLRSIRAVVRDRDWNTAALVVDDVTVGASTLDIRVHTRDLGADLAGSVRVEADGDTLAVRLDLASASPFLTNRTGLVVLHPARLAGTSLRAVHTDGTVDATTFPRRISPHQPVLDIRTLSWVHAGVGVTTRFDGDTFEMEDQRNWSDASYKTYSRPLALPFPYRIDAGASIRQSVRVQAARTDVPAVIAEPDRLELVAGGTFPDILLAASTAPDPAPPASAVGAGTLVELDLACPAWRAALRRPAAPGLPLDVRLVLDGDDGAALDAAARALRDVDMLRVSAFPARHLSDAATVSALRAALARAGVDAPVVGGARSHFTELNREHHRLPDTLDGIVFSVTPLFHSRGTEQLVESLAIQRVIATQAVSMTSAPVHVGPISLRPHFNDVATTAPPRPAHADLRAGYGPELLDADDRRQSAPELAAWTVASAAALAVPGVASLAYFEDWGPRGIRAATGEEFPVAAAIHALVRLRGSHLLHAQSPDGLLWAIGGSAHGRARVLVANAGRHARHVTVAGAVGKRTLTVNAGSWSTLLDDPSTTPGHDTAEP